MTQTFYPKKLCPKTGILVERDFVQPDQPECIHCPEYVKKKCVFNGELPKGQRTLFGW